MNESWIARANLLLAQVHGAFGEWREARESAQQALARARRLASDRSWDRNRKIVNEAQALISECLAKGGN